MSSPPEDKLRELEKNGVSPAIKAGGMRITRKEKRNSESGGYIDAKDDGSDQSSSNNGDELAEIRQSNNILASSGLAQKTKRDYPPEAIRLYQEKIIDPPPKAVKMHQAQLFQPQKKN